MVLEIEPGQPLASQMPYKVFCLSHQINLLTLCAEFMMAVLNDRRGMKKHLT